MTKDQKMIKAQSAQIDNLSNEVARLKSDFESVLKCKEMYSNELADIHSCYF